jgi:hypothetical protein
MVAKMAVSSVDMMAGLKVLKRAALTVAVMESW